MSAMRLIYLISNDLLRFVGAKIVIIRKKVVTLHPK